MKDHDAVIVGRLLAALTPFFELRQTLPARAIEAFLLVALYPGGSVADYAKRAGMSHSSMSRNLADLRSRNRFKQEGFGLIAEQSNPDNASHKQHFLSPKGQTLLTRVLDVLKGKRYAQNHLVGRRRAVDNNDADGGARRTRPAA